MQHVSDVSKRIMEHDSSQKVEKVYQKNEKKLKVKHFHNKNKWEKLSEEIENSLKTLNNVSFQRPLGGR